MPRGKWEIPNYDGCDKSISITSPLGVDIQIAVDYDDVNHDVVDVELRQLVKLLNEHWENIPKDGCKHQITDAEGALCNHPDAQQVAPWDRVCGGNCLKYDPKG